MEKPIKNEDELRQETEIATSQRNVLALEKQYDPEWYEDLEDSTEFRVHEVTDEEWNKIMNPWETG